MEDAKTCIIDQQEGLKQPGKTLAGKRPRAHIVMRMGT
jgi:hypothetical protein